MLQKTILLAALFLIAVTTIVLTNDDVPIEALHDTTLYMSSAIDTNETLQINSAYNPNSSFDKSDEELQEYAKSKISVIESDSLTNTIEIYTLDVYHNITDTVVIDISGNTLTITSDLAPLSLYKSSSFLTFGQFDSNYFNRIPWRLYEVHIPSGMLYTID